MKPTKPNSNSNQTQTKTGTEQNRDRTEHPATPTRSFISRPRRNPFRKSATESSPWLCSHSSELNTSPRIVSNPARLSKPLCEFLLRAGRLATYQASTRALESAVSRQVWPILRFPARIANFFSESIPANRLNASDTRSLHVACQAGPPRLQAAAHCTNSPQKFGSSALSVGPPGAIKPAAPRSTAFHGRQKILCHRPATGIFFRAGAIHWSIPSGFILGRQGYSEGFAGFFRLGFRPVPIGRPPLFQTPCPNLWGDQGTGPGVVVFGRSVAAGDRNVGATCRVGVPLPAQVEYGIMPYQKRGSAPLTLRKGRGDEHHPL